MARIRTIKPDFWVDEKIVELTPWARLLFIGLWNLADDDGRLVYSPKKIKFQLFPADSIEVADICRELTARGLVLIYKNGDATEYLQVKHFSDHQKIDKRRPSKLPDPNSDACRQVPPNLADSPRISPTEVEVEVEVEVEKEVEKEVEGEKPLSKPKIGFDWIDHGLQTLFAHYLERTGKNPNLYDLTPARRKKGAARLRFCHKRASEPKNENAVAMFKVAIDRFAASEYHNGSNPQGKKYLDWDLLCRSDEYFTKWLDDDNFEGVRQ